VKFLVNPGHGPSPPQDRQSRSGAGRSSDKPRYFPEYFAQNPVMVSFARQVPYTARDGRGPPDLQEIFDAISQEYEACAVYGRSRRRRGSAMQPSGPG